MKPQREWALRMKRIAEKSRQALTEIAGNRTRNRLSPIPTQGNRTSVCVWSEEILSSLPRKGLKRI
jgi:hypothetical protein